VYGGGLAENVTGAVLLQFSGRETKLKMTLNMSLYPDAHLDNGR